MTHSKCIWQKFGKRPCILTFSRPVYIYPWGSMLAIFRDMSMCSPATYVGNVGDFWQHSRNHVFDGFRRGFDGFRRVSMSFDGFRLELRPRIDHNKIDQNWYFYILEPAKRIEDSFDWHFWQHTALSLTSSPAPLLVYMDGASLERFAIGTAMCKS